MPTTTMNGEKSVLTFLRELLRSQSWQTAIWAERTCLLKSLSVKFWNSPWASCQRNWRFPLSRKWSEYDTETDRCGAFLYTSCAPVGTANIHTNRRILLIANSLSFVAFSPQNLPVLLLPKSVCPVWWQPLSSVSGCKRYNTLDFASKIACQQGCFSPLLETQSQGILSRLSARSALQNALHFEVSAGALLSSGHPKQRRTPFPFGTPLSIVRWLTFIVEQHLADHAGLAVGWSKTSYWTFFSSMKLE